MDCFKLGALKIQTFYLFIYILVGEFGPSRNNIVGPPTTCWWSTMGVSMNGVGRVYDSNMGASQPTLSYSSPPMDW